jgi:hypothetical protein
MPTFRGGAAGAAPAQPPPRAALHAPGFDNTSGKIYSARKAPTEEEHTVLGLFKRKK